MDTNELVIKTAVNTRAPLASRLPRKKPTDLAQSSYALHKTRETTYDIAYVGANADGRNGSARFALPRLNGADATTSMGDGEGAGAGAGAGVGVGGGAGAGTDSDAGDFEMQQSIQQQAARDLIPYKVMAAPSSQWESVAHAATRAVQPEQQLDFYSNVRKAEKIDDDLRGGLVGGTQRSMEIRTKRAFDESMRPQTPIYHNAEPVEMPLVAAQEKGLVRRNYLDLVECSHLDPDTEEQIGFDQHPVGRLPGMDLSQEHPVQSKAISKMGTSVELFRGFPKYVDDKTIGYAGHIPMHDRNLEAIHGGVDARRVFAKSYMTLAVHGGGVDASVTSKNIRAKQRTGRAARAPQMLKPKTDANICKTVEGSMLQSTYKQTLDRERTMNIRDDKQGKNYF